MPPKKNAKEPKENTWCYTLFLGLNVTELHLDLEIKSVEKKSSVSVLLYYIIAIEKGCQRVRTVTVDLAQF